MCSLFGISTVTINRLLSPPASSIGSKLIFIRNKTTSSAANILLSVGRENFANTTTTTFLRYPSSQLCRKLTTITHQNLPKLHNTKIKMTTSRSLSKKRLTKNLILYTNEPLRSEIDKNNFKIEKPTGRPLVLIMAWMMSKENQLRKYVDVYIDLGFDALVVSMTPWQLLWPVKGTQITAMELLKFLHSNKSIQPIVVHGFSVGGYQFGELLVLIANNKEKYQHILDRFACQIWDSLADILEIGYGTSKSIFPNSPLLQKILSSYINYHTKAFHDQATSHYYRARDVFQIPLLRAPTLFYVSRNDPVGLESNSKDMEIHWKKQNIPVTFYCWEKSVHVSHFIYHKDEYLSLLFNHLRESGLIKDFQNAKAKL